MEYKQVVEQECQETNINIDYFDKEIVIYTNKATVMNRMSKNGYKPMEIGKVRNGISSCTYKFTFQEFPRLISASIFKCS